MISLGITEKMILLQTDSYRVVGVGLSGYRMSMTIELAHKDVLGEVSWHLVDEQGYDRNGKTSDTDVLPDALYAALDALMTARARLLRTEDELAEVNARIAGLEK